MVKSTPSLSRISLVGNSLGGLYTRYAAMLLYRCDDHGKKRPPTDSDEAIQSDEHASDPPARTTAGPDGEDASEGADEPNFPAGKEPPAAAARASVTRRRGRETIAGLKPSVFMTIASPHLGVRRFTYLPVPPPLHPLAGVLVGKTGSDLFLSKRDGENRPRGSLRFSSPRASASTAGAAGLTDPSRAGLRASASVLGAVGRSGDDSNEGLGGGSGGEGGVGRETSLLYNMATSEEFLRPLRAFRWRRAYANRRGDFMVPYGTAAFVEHDEDDRAAESPENGGGRGADAVGGGTGTDAFSIADHVLGARQGAIVGMSRVPPSAPRVVDDSGGGIGREEGGALEAGRAGLLARVRTRKSKGEKRRSMEEEMAAGLNSCGWEKVGAICDDICVGTGQSCADCEAFGGGVAATILWYRQSTTLRQRGCALVSGQIDCSVTLVDCVPRSSFVGVGVSTR